MARIRPEDAEHGRAAPGIPVIVAGYSPQRPPSRLEEPDSAIGPSLKCGSPGVAALLRAANQNRAAEKQI
jgi:hypothetical protein